MEYLHLPNDDAGKAGLDDYLVDGHTAEDLWKLVRPNPPPIPDKDLLDADYVEEPEAAEPAEPISLAQAHAVFHKWLGADYDTDACNVVLATLAVEKFDDGSDPIWLLVVSGSGNAKTETVQACGTGPERSSPAPSPATPRCRVRRPRRSAPRVRPAGCCAASASAGCWSSRTLDHPVDGPHPAREGARGAPGGLRRPLGRRRSAPRGKVLSWRGRIAVIGAVTMAWDAHHAVIAPMGDRFVLLRLDSTRRGWRRVARPSPISAPRPRSAPIAEAAAA